MTPHTTFERCLECATDEELAAALNNRWSPPILTTDAPRCPYQVDPGPPTSTT